MCDTSQPKFVSLFNPIMPSYMPHWGKATLDSDVPKGWDLQAL